MRIVVTGGAGFIGANLVRELLGRGHDPLVIDDLSTGAGENLDGVDVTLYEGTILDRELLDQAFAGADAVVHLAARPSVPRSIADPVASHRVNATGSLEVLEGVRRAGGLPTVLASSSSVYGSNPTLPKSEDLRAQPMSPYAVSKLATEQYALAYGACFALPVLPLRFFNVYGPLQAPGHAYAAALPVFLDHALKGLPIPIDGDGEQTRDFTFVGSVTAAIATVVERGLTSHEAINLAFGSRRSILTAVDTLEQQLGVELERQHRPPRAGDVRHSQGDSGRLRALLPDLEPVPFEDGLGATVDWFVDLPAYADSEVAAKVRAARATTGVSAPTTDPA